MRSLYFKQTGPNFITQPQHYYFTPSYTSQPYYNIGPNSPVSQNPTYQVYPDVPTQFNRNIVPSPPLAPSQPYQTSPNGPIPGPHQNWIYQPSNSYFFLGDHNASYYTFPYEVDPKTEIVIRGRYPYARYFTFNIASIPSHRLVDSVVGRELIPDPGSTNPFMPGANWDATNRNYTLRIRFTAPPEGSNHFVPGAGNNVIYAGTFKNGEPNRFGMIVLRIYVPSIGYDKTGGVDLPFITYSSEKDKGHRTHCNFESSSLYSAELQNTNQQNNNQQNQMDFDDFINLNYFANSNKRNNIKMDFRQGYDLTWKRFAPRFLQPEGNTVYTLSNLIDRDPDKLLFIRWKAPTFPDTYRNFGIVGDEDMQYWSMSFITPIGLAGLYTISDYQTIIDKSGYVNLVISFGASRPSSVTPENGFTWIDASQLPLVPLFLFYRNNQISENFLHHTAADVPTNEIVTPQDMGNYYPFGKYVDTMFFEQI
ncbi:hypothetical protein [Alkalihalobacterium chitinilyticum]|uniref:Uncharacterized protein n=1 Tax=Alkalihalobacterium chitinilyticum TaxID=2980103 RepID=A0ABT5VG49_9BACI|nr:hypothetical protein [Alkalihalobacterium chitinilyticum]MDE5414255.1 hypothetical protein [Alkalihalobacterium chitinilyticum]